jgi:hypothetical protein
MVVLILLKFETPYQLFLAIGHDFDAARGKRSNEMEKRPGIAAVSCSSARTRNAPRVIRQFAGVCYRDFHRDSRSKWRSLVSKAE